MRDGHVLASHGSLLKHDGGLGGAKIANMAVWWKCSEAKCDHLGDTT